MSLKLRKSLMVCGILVFGLTQLSGCSFTGKRVAKDGPPSRDFDASKIPNAVPRIEPLSRHGNKSYVIGRHRYNVLPRSNGYHARGIASWYGTRFHGRYTSARERYSLYKMTAASPILPLPTYVRVTNLANGKQVIVKVNDRGPFRCNRILDVSYAAAKKLGFSSRGTARVDIQAIDPRRWLALHRRGAHLSART